MADENHNQENCECCAVQRGVAKVFEKHRVDPEQGIEILLGMVARTALYDGVKRVDFKSGDIKITLNYEKQTDKTEH